MTPVNRDESVHGRPLGTAMTHAPPRTRTIGRKRRAVGWVLVTLGSFVAATWLASGWWRLTYADGVGTARISEGGVISAPDLNPPRRSRLTFDEAQFPTSVTFRERFELWCGVYTARNFPPGILYSFGIGYVIFYDSGELFVFLTLWPFALAAWSSGAACFGLAARARHRALANKCKFCGYDLTGLATTAACPECGKAARAPAPTADAS